MMYNDDESEAGAVRKVRKVHTVHTQTHTNNYYIHLSRQQYLPLYLSIRSKPIGQQHSKSKMG